MKTAALLASLLALALHMGCHTTNGPTAPDDSDVLATARQEQPRFSHDDQSIIFIGEYDSVNAVHFIDKEGNYLGHLLDVPAKNATRLLNSASWGPTDKRILVSIDGNLVALNTDGDSLVQLTSTGIDFDCVWSRDGRTIAYTKSICDPDCGVMALDLGTMASSIAAPYGGHASWNANSTTIYYYYNVFDPKPAPLPAEYAGFVLARINVSSGKRDTLFSVSNPNLLLEDCCVSPDEQEILFSAAAVPGPHSNIWKVNLATHELTQLTTRGGLCPSYSSDGTKIVYSNTNIAEGGLWMMDRNGANQRRLTKLSR